VTGPGVASLLFEKKDSEMNRPKLIPAAIPIAVALYLLMNLVVITAKADAANPLGTLTQLSGQAGCLSAYEHEECTGSEPAQDAFRLTSSADGKNVYLASASWSEATITTLDRGPGGRLSDGHDNCFKDVSSEGREWCEPVRGLLNLADIEVSPDGRQLYAAAQGEFSPDDTTITTFDRDPATGALTPVAGEAGCVSSSEIEGCRTVRTISDTVDLTASPDGETLYAAQNTSPGGGVTALHRDPATGRLSQLEGAASCIHDGAATAECRSGEGINETWKVAVSPDGRFAYAAGQNNGEGTIGVMSIDPQDGSLTQVDGAGGCYSGQATVSLAGECTALRGMGGADFGAPLGLTMSADGENIYAYSSGRMTAGHSTLTTLVRDPETGALTQPAGEAGCLMADAEAVSEGCGSAKALLGVWDAAVSPDGSAVYTVSYRGLGNNGGLAVFDRGADGTLTQKAAPYGCFTSLENAEEDGCTTVRQMSGGNGLTVSPDSGSVYVAAYDSGSVAAFTRQAAPVCDDGAATVAEDASVTLRLDCFEPNGETLEFGITGQPEHGTLGQIDQAAGTVVYTPAPGFSGTDSITYRAEDGTYTSNADGRLDITVTAKQDPPPPPPPPVVKDSAIQILTKGTVRASRKGVVTVRAACDGDGADCQGALALASAKVRVRPGKPKRAVKLGGASYQVKPGATVAIRVKLTRTGFRVLKRAKKLKVTARATPGVSEQAPAAGKFILKPAQRKR